MTKRLLLVSLTLLCFNRVFPGCMDGWKYNRQITVTNSNGSAYTDFQVKITLNTSSLISSGKMQASGNDIRFTDANCNPLYFWVDAINSTTTTIWVKVSSIPSSGSTNINMFYGNGCAASVQNGDSTFLLFDDFSGGTINSAKWNHNQVNPGAGTSAIAGGTLTFNNTASSDNNISSVATFPGPIWAETRVVSNSGTWPSVALLNSGSFLGVTLFTGTGVVVNNQLGIGSTAVGCASYSGATFNTSGVTRTNGIWGVSWTATNAANAIVPGGTASLATTTTIGANQYAAFGLLCTGVGSMEIDWAIVRKRAPIEIATTVNAENRQGVQIGLSTPTICPGAPFTIYLTKSSVYFNTGNVFKVELSDASGSFGSPVQLGSISDTIPDTIVTVFPKTVPPGTGYKIRVTTTSPAFNCFTVDTSITVYPKPLPAYSFLNDNQCYKYNKYNFTSTSSISAGTIDSYIWNWGDASKIDTLTTAAVSHHFSPFYAYYYPRLTVVSNLGCTDSISHQVNIKESPDVLTEFNDTIQCYKGNRFIIKSKTKLVSGSLAFISWDLGDGSAVKTGIDSFSYQFASAGTYFVRQINHHSNGCKDTGILAALVNTHPVAQIGTNDTDQCLNGNDFVFESKSTITNGLPLVNYWDISDGMTRDMQDSVHWSYASANNRTIRLITISDDGLDGCSDTAYQKILVNPMPKALVNNYDLEKCFNYNKFRFKGKSTIAYGTISHNWNFGDNTTANNVDSVSHSYAAEGSYTIKIYAISNKGCSDSTTTSVIVRPSPVPKFTISKDIQCLKYNLFKAFSQTTISSGTLSRIWQVSDGMTYTDVDSIAHPFSAQGNYEIELIAKSSYNCADTTSDSVFVLPMPASSFAVNNTDQCLLGNLFSFTDNSSFSSGSLTGNKWLFDDGATAANQATPSHSYGVENMYHVGLIAYANNSCFDTSFQDITVYPHPGSDFIINDTGQCVNNNSFVFNNNTFISTGSFTNRWFYGDGSAFEDKLTGSHKYKKDSLFIVKIISFSDHGCTDTAWKTITVFPKAKTDFTIDNTDQCKLGNNFNFASATTLKKGTYSLGWNFGDGATLGNFPTAQHSYSGVQAYNVRLVSQTNEGCLDTMNKTVRTLPMPVASFNPTFDKSCLKGNNFEFNANSTGALSISHNWYFGDNDSAINTNYILHSYQNYGTFTVTVIAIAKNGSCKDTTSKTVTVFPMPVASFTVDNNQQCFTGNNFNFNSTATIPTGTIDVTNWNFGDKTTSTIANPSKSYNKVDSFRVSLLVTSDNGCTDSTASKVYVFPMPTADFTISPKSSCLKKNSFAITNKSKITNGVISKYQFYYGDNDSSLLQDPTPHSYKTAGEYTVLLRVTTNKGCWDTISTYVSVNANPTLDFQVDPVCLKDSSHFINKSTLAGTGSIAAWKWVFGDGKISTLESPAHKYKAVGTYNILLVGTTDKGCVDSLLINGAAVVNPNPTARFLYQKLRSWENEVDIQYIDSSRGAVSWKWDFASMGTSTDQNPKLFYVDTLTQPTTLVVTNAFGCKDTSFQLLFIAPDVIYYMPNAFTPNDDNINETFKPKGLAYAINYKFIIFDRWGNILFKTDNPQLGWDGKFEDELVEQDVYFYRLEFVGADELRHEEKGHVVVLR